MASTLCCSLATSDLASSSATDSSSRRPCVFVVRAVSTKKTASVAMKRPNPAKIRAPMEWNQLRISVPAQFGQMGPAPFDPVPIQQGLGYDGQCLVPGGAVGIRFDGLLEPGCS